MDKHQLKYKEVLREQFHTNMYMYIYFLFFLRTIQIINYQDNTNKMRLLICYSFRYRIKNAITMLVSPFESIPAWGKVTQLLMRPSAPTGARQ